MRLKARFALPFPSSLILALPLTAAPRQLSRQNRPLQLITSPLNLPIWSVPHPFPMPWSKDAPPLCVIFNTPTRPHWVFPHMPTPAASLSI